MSEADDYRRRCERLLQEAAQTFNMKERGRLIDETMQWHQKALQAIAPPQAEPSHKDHAAG